MNLITNAVFHEIKYKRFYASRVKTNSQNLALIKLRTKQSESVIIKAPGTGLVPGIFACSRRAFVQTDRRKYRC